MHLTRTSQLRVYRCTNCLENKYGHQYPCCSSVKIYWFLTGTISNLGNFVQIKVLPDHLLVSISSVPSQILFRSICIKKVPIELDCGLELFFFSFTSLSETPSKNLDSDAFHVQLRMGYTKIQRENELQYGNLHWWQVCRWLKRDYYRVSCKNHFLLFVHWFRTVTWQRHQPKYYK